MSRGRAPNGEKETDALKPDYTDEGQRKIQEYLESGRILHFIMNTRQMPAEDEPGTREETRDRDGTRNVLPFL